MNEEWAWVVGFEGLYEVSTLGRIRSWRRRGAIGSGNKIDSPVLIAGTIDKRSIRHVALYRADGKVYHTVIRQCVLKAFAGPPRGKLTAPKHKDDNPLNCAASNLEWANPAVIYAAHRIRSGDIGRTFGKAQRLKILIAWWSVFRIVQPAQAVLMCRKRPPKPSSLNRRRYGLGPDGYEAMFTAQQGLCSICRRPETRRSNKACGAFMSLAVDHDHQSGRVRGLLCARCNTRLGVIEELGADGIGGMLRYLRQHGASMSGL